MSCQAATIIAIKGTVYNSQFSRGELSNNFGSCLVFCLTSKCRVHTHVGPVRKHLLQFTKFSSLTDPVKIVR